MFRPASDSSPEAMRRCLKAGFQGSGHADIYTYAMAAVPSQPLPPALIHTRHSSYP
jgi:hypothetical protein